MLTSRSQIIISQLNESIRTGQWLILQSGAHTKTQIIKRINHLLDIKESNEFHQDFRLWIIVLETKAFPLEMLQSSFKGLSEFIHVELHSESVVRLSWSVPFRRTRFTKKCLFIVSNSWRRMRNEEGMKCLESES